MTSRSLFRAALTGLIVVGFTGATPPTAPATSPKIQPQAIEQLQALQEEKRTRSPAQQKLDSTLARAARRRAGDPVALRAPVLREVIEYELDGTVLVDIRAEVTDGLLEAIRVRGGRVVNDHPRFRAVRAALPLDQMEAIAARSGVDFIRRAGGFVTNGQALTRKNDTSEGDVAHRAPEARQILGDGSGAKICVISDGVDSLAASQSSGDLPANIDVLSGQAGSGDEGTAMLEIVYDLAPGADLGFATALGGEAQFAQNILDLRDDGCDVIVDDIFYFAEGVFQDDVIAQAVETVIQDGAIFFSSAGNSGNLNDGTAGVYEGDFDGMAGSGPLMGDTVHDFGSGSQLDEITKDPPFVILLTWADPLGGSSNDYDLCLLNAAGSSIFLCANNVQNGTQDPFEFISSQAFNDLGNQLAVVQTSGSDRYFHLNTVRGELADATDGQTAGHSATDNVFGVAAVNAALGSPTPPRTPAHHGDDGFITRAADRRSGDVVGRAFDGTESVETFSSDGPRQVFFTAAGAAITPGNFSSTGGTVRQKPDIAAADGVSTSAPGFSTFFGTSAAAPHAAAIAGLLVASDPSVDAERFRQIMSLTAFDIEAPGIDRDSGYGLVDAVRAARAVKGMFFIADDPRPVPGPLAGRAPEGRWPGPRVPTLLPGPLLDPPAR